MDTRSTNYSTAESFLDREERRIAVRRADDAPREGADATADVVVTFRQAKARVIADFESAYLRALLQRAKGNVSLAARLAGKERSRFNRLIRKHRIVARDFRPGPARESEQSDALVSSC